jgi:hypothetical protein
MRAACAFPHAAPGQRSGGLQVGAWAAQARRRPCGRLLGRFPRAPLAAPQPAPRIHPLLFACFRAVGIVWAPRLRQGKARVLLDSGVRLARLTQPAAVASPSSAAPISLQAHPIRAPRGSAPLPLAHAPLGPLGCRYWAAPPCWCSWLALSMPRSSLPQPATNTRPTSSRRKPPAVHPHRLAPVCCRLP